MVVGGGVGGGDLLLTLPPALLLPSNTCPSPSTRPPESDNVGLYTTQMDTYLAHLDALNVSYLTATWTSEGWSDDVGTIKEVEEQVYAGYSAFVHV